MGKKKPAELAAQYEKFHAGMLGNDYSEEAIKALWDVMLPFSGYAFNKSHTAGYGSSPTGPPISRPTIRPSTWPLC